jgi:hypothetical protein
MPSAHLPPDAFGISTRPHRLRLVAALKPASPDRRALLLQVGVSLATVPSAQRHVNHCKEIAANAERCRKATRGATQRGATQESDVGAGITSLS